MKSVTRSLSRAENAVMALIQIVLVMRPVDTLCGVNYRWWGVLSDREVKNNKIIGE